MASKRIEIPGIIFAPQQPALGAAALRIAILVDSVIIVLCDQDSPFKARQRRVVAFKKDWNPCDLIRTRAAWSSSRSSVENWLMV